MGNYAGHVEKRPVDILRISKVLAESPLGTVALRFGDFGVNGRIIPSVGVLVQLLCKLLSYQTGKLTGIQTGDVADGVDSVGEQPFFGFLSDPEQIPDPQRPHLLLDLIGP